MTECNRCGKCCHILTSDGTITNKECQYLIHLSNGKTRCKIYKTRLGTKIDKTHRCGMRTDFPFNIPNCPQNRKEWKDAREETK